MLIVEERLSRETGREYALRNLKQNIKLLHLEPGAKISEKEIATALGLSRTPVREALLELSKVNIVQVFPQKGCSIAYINFQQVEESLFMRLTLECAVAEICCDLATEEDFKKLEDIMKLHEFCQNELNSEEKCLEQDNAFHEVLFLIAKKPHVFQSMRGLAIHLDRLCALALPDVTSNRVIEDHRSILDAIQSKNKLEARDRMTTHLNRPHMSELHLQQRFPAYFE